MEIEKSTTDKSKLILVVAVIILVGTLFGAMGYLLGSKNNNTAIKSEDQMAKDQDIDSNKETEKDENIKDDWQRYVDENNNFEFILPKELVFSGIIQKGDKGGSGNLPSSNEEIIFEPMGSSMEYTKDNDSIIKWNIKDKSGEVVFSMFKESKIKSGNVSNEEFAKNYPTPKDKITNMTLASLNYNNEIIKQEFDISDPLLKSGPWYYTSNKEYFYIFIVNKDDNKELVEKILSTFKFTDFQDETADWKIYTNNKYGFEVTLLDSWKGYEVLTESWKGTSLDGDSKQYQGPQIIIRNPKWSVSKPWQDIPIMVFTKDEWGLIETKNLSVNAAPIGPNKIDENQEYVFALPPRWTGFTDNLGQDEAQEISKTIKAISISTNENETANWQIYENKEYGFELQYPENIEYYSKTWGVDFVEKSKTQNKIFTTYLYNELKQLPNNEAGLSFEDWINKQIENKTFEDGKIFSNGALTGIKVRDHGIVPFQNLLIKKDDKIYSFVIREDSQFMDIFDQIISTLKSINCW